MTDPTKADTAEVRNLDEVGREVSTTEAANVKAAVDEQLVKYVALPAQQEEGKRKAAAQKSVDNALMRYFVVHLHRLLDPATPGA